MKKVSDKNKLKNTFLMVLFCIMFQQITFAETFDMQKSNSKAGNAPQTIKQESAIKNTQDADTKINETPAHAAVTGSITPAQIEKINKQSEVNKIDVSNLDEIKVLPEKSTLKNHFSSVLLKFILAIIWVIISSITIFIILISYKKLVLGNQRIKPTYESKAKSLDVPTNFKEAIKLFLDKTKWD